MRARTAHAHHGRELAPRRTRSPRLALSGSSTVRSDGSSQRSDVWSLANAPPPQGLCPCTPELAPRAASSAWASWRRERRGDRTRAIRTRGAGAEPLRRLAVGQRPGVRSLGAPIGSPAQGARPRGTGPRTCARRRLAAMESKTVHTARERFGDVARSRFPSP